MANVLLTQRCTRSCPYCFAIQHMESSPPRDVLSWENLIYLVDLHLAAGDRHIQFLGGEPTLHPDFVDFCLYAIQRGMSVGVFTNGMMPAKKLAEAEKHFAGLPPEALGFVCNLNHPDITPEAEARQVRAFLDAFGPRITPGFNIYRTDFDLDFLFDAIARHGLQRAIRLGLTHPIPGTENSHIPIPEIQAVAARLMAYRDKFERQRVRPNLDCGFPMCLFTDEFKGWLYSMTGGQFNFGCSPVVDIGPDMSVWSCFPLSSHHKRSLFEFDSLAEVYDFYLQRHHAIRVEVGGVFEACDDCRYRQEDVCMGGCAAHALAAFKDEAPVRLPEFYP